MIRNALLLWRNDADISSAVLSDVPKASVAAAPEMVLEKLRHTGLVVLPVCRESNWLSVNFVNLPKPPDSVFTLLEKIAQQTVWLDMNSCQTPEMAWHTVGKLINLTRLSLDHSSINDTALLPLKNLQQLQYLNLSNTTISEKGLRQLEGIKHLKSIFLYKTATTSADFPGLQSIFPLTKLDTGNYVLPFLETDTARLKANASY